MQEELLQVMELTTIVNVLVDCNGYVNKVGEEFWHEVEVGWIFSAQLHRHLEQP